MFYSFSLFHTFRKILTKYIDTHHEVIKIIELNLQVIIKIRDTDKIRIRL